MAALGRVAGRAAAVGEVAVGDQGVGVVGAEHPQQVVEQLLERGDGGADLTGVSEAASGPKHDRVGVRADEAVAAVLA
nr:hypothetical protein GCM10020092_088540 [Actinoplanes digitatis]